MAVQRNIYKCVDCTWWQPTYCVGKHECLYYISEGKVSAWDNVQHIAVDDVRSIKAGDTSFFSNFDQTGKIMRQAMGDKQAIFAALLAWSEEILKRMPVPGDTRIHADVKPMALYTADSERWNPDQKFTGFNGAGNIVHDSGLPATINGKKCETATELEAEYNQCNFDTNYDALIRSVQSTMQVSEGLIIPPGFRAAYWTDKQHMLSNGIPSWSKVNRDARQTFLPTLLNKTAQCRYASREESVCSLESGNSNRYYYINPWLGGAFNVFEASDDFQEGGSNSPLSLPPKHARLKSLAKSQSEQIH